MKFILIALLALFALAACGLFARSTGSGSARPSALSLRLRFACASFLSIRRPAHEGSIALANIGEGVHNGGRITRKADAALTTRYLLVKSGSDANHTAVCGTGDIPLGVCEDEPTAAEETAVIQLFGSADKTLLVVASAAIAVDAFVVSAASGKVRTLPATTGTYYVIGRALQAAAADGDQIEIDPCFPVQRVVA